METSLRGPLVVKPTREELQARVKLLVKKRRSVKRKAQDPPESSLPAQGKTLKRGIYVPPSLVKERGSHAQVQVRGQALLSLAEVSEVACAQRRSSSAAGAKGSLRRAAKPLLKVLLISIWSPSTQNATPSRGDVGNDCFGAEGGEDSLFTNTELSVRVVSSILRDSDLKKVDALCVEETFALLLQGTISVCPSAFFYLSHRYVNVIC